MKLPAFNLLSKEQDRILNLPLDGSYLVTGPPGSGKTVIALYRAQMLHNRGQRSVLLLYNRALTSYVSAATRSLGVAAETIAYYRWLERSYRDYYRTSPPMLSEWKHDWNRILTRVNAEPPPRGSLPYLIIDEGQDLPPMFYQLARYLARNLTVLADGNQVLHEDNSSLEEIRANALIAHRPELLTKNYRNSKQIAEFSACFHSGIETGVAEIPTRIGPPIELREHQVRQQSVQRIVRYFEQHPKAEIGVFLPNSTLVKSYVYRLKKKLGEAHVQYYYREGRSRIDTLAFDKPAIRVMNYWNTKGLEYDAVFLPELQDFDGDPNAGRTKMLFYVLLSRAREHLFLYYIKHETPLIGMMKRYLLEIGNRDDDDFDDDEEASAS